MKSYLRYAYAILAVPLSVLLRFALMPLTGPGIPFITLFPATVIVALLGGMGPAVLTGVLGVLASDYFFVTPLHSFDIGIDFWSRSTVVVLTSTFVGYVGKVLREAKYGLEIKVKERTAELMKINESLRLEEARLDALLQLSQLSEATLDKITGFTLEQAIAMTQSKIGFVGFLSEDETTYTLHSVSKDVIKECNVEGDPMHWPVSDAGIWADAVRERKTLFVNDYSKPHPRKKGIPAGHVPIERFMVVPFFEGERIVAVVGVGNKASGYDKSDERQIVLLLSGMWSCVLKNRSREELQNAYNKLEERVKQRTAELAASTAALEESQKDLNRAQAVAHTGSWRLDVQKNELTWSDEAYRIFGVSKETPLTYESFLSYVHPDDKKYVDAKWKAALVGEKYDIEHRIIVEGQIKWVRERANLEFEKNGKLLGGFGTVTDITQRKLAEEELRKAHDELEIRVQQRTAELSQSEEKFRMMAENIPDVFWISTPGVEKIIYVSPAYEEIWGRTCESLYESPQAFIETVYPEDMENVRAALISSHTKGFWDLEYRIIRQDGTICWVRNRGLTIRDTQGNINMMTGAVTDITRRKQVESSLKEQARTMDAFFEHTITPIVFLDRDFNFIRVNEAYARACQRDISEFKGHNYFEFYPHEENQRIFEEVVRTKTPYEAHAKPFTFLDHPEWGITYWDWILVPVLDNSGEVEFLVFSLEDVTERKEGQDTIIADQEQLRRLSSELLMVEEQERHKLAIDLHDSVGQILAFMKIELGNLRRSGVPAKTAEVLDHVLEQVKEAIKQTRTLTFEISPPELYTIGLESAIQELLQRFAEERNLQYHFEATEGPIPLSEHIKILLYRSVRELLINTDKHAKAETVDVTIYRVDNNIQVTIEDDGKGFDVSRLKKNSNVQSSGFGLLSIRERLRRISGKLDIQSSDGQGTRITLIAPL